MGLSERIEQNTDLSYYEGQIPVHYQYTYGLGNEKFFQSIKKDGTFLGSRCPECGATYVPCRIYCEECFSAIDKTFKIPGTGTVYSYTVSHYNMDGSPKKKPDVVGLIELDGTEGSKMVNLIDAKPEDVEIGKKVKPVIKAKKDRKGGLGDIAGFKIVK